jgi:hypothetical protein
MTDYNELVNDLREYLVNTEISDALKAQAREIAAKDARIAELEAALKPFADAWDEKETWQWQINIDDLRAARSVLKGERG